MLKRFFALAAVLAVLGFSAVPASAAINEPMGGRPFISGTVSGQPITSEDSGRWVSRLFSSNTGLGSGGSSDYNNSTQSVVNGSSLNLNLRIMSTPTAPLDSADFQSFYPSDASVFCYELASRSSGYMFSLELDDFVWYPGNADVAPIFLYDTSDGFNTVDAVGLLSFTLDYWVRTTLASGAVVDTLTSEEFLIPVSGYELGYVELMYHIDDVFPSGVSVAVVRDFTYLSYDSTWTVMGIVCRAVGGTSPASDQQTAVVQFYSGAKTGAVSYPPSSDDGLGGFFSSTIDGVFGAVLFESNGISVTLGTLFGGVLGVLLLIAVFKWLGV